jgi:hypothetical protein
MLRKGNLISLKDCYHHYPYPKAAFLVLTDTDDPFPPRAGAYIKALDKNGTIINLPYSQLYMYEAIT